MLPKSNRDRSRLIAAGFGVSALVFMIIGVFIGLSQQNWLVFFLALGIAACGAMYLYSQERGHKEP